MSSLWSLQVQSAGSKASEMDVFAGPREALVHLRAAVLVSCELGWVAMITRIVKPLSPQMRFSLGDDSHDLQPARGYGAVDGAFRFRLLRSSVVAQLVLSAGSTRSASARKLRASIREAGCTK